MAAATETKASLGPSAKKNGEFRELVWVCGTGEENVSLCHGLRALSYLVGEGKIVFHLAGAPHNTWHMPIGCPAFLNL